MAILHLSTDKRFDFTNQVDTGALAKTTETALFGDPGYHVIKGFIQEDIVERLRTFFTDRNNTAFRNDRSPLRPFHGQSLIVYYPRGPFAVPPILRSLYERISLLRNMVYVNQPFYRDYCEAFGLNPTDYARVYQQQMCHTWFRVSWYKDRDGQHPHYDQYGEIAAFLMLTKKGVHWKTGGLHIYDEDGKAIVDVDALCEPGDLLWMDQHRLIHAVEPIIGADPGRLLIYVPIIPLSYMEPWYTFEHHPWTIFHTIERVPLGRRVRAGVENAYRNLTGTKRIHYSRRAYPHVTPDL